MNQSSVAILDFDAADATSSLLDLLAPDDSCPFDADPDLIAAAINDPHVLGFTPELPVQSPVAAIPSDSEGTAGANHVEATGKAIGEIAENVLGQDTTAVTTPDLGTRAHAEIVPGVENPDPSPLADLTTQNAESSTTTSTASPAESAGMNGGASDGQVFENKKIGNVISSDGNKSKNSPEATGASGAISENSQNAAGVNSSPISENKKIPSVVASVSNPGPRRTQSEESEKLWRQIFNLETQIENQGKVVLEQTVTVAQMEKRVKSARKDLKEATEDLIELQGKLVDAKQERQELEEKEYQELRVQMARAERGDIGPNPAPASPSLVDGASPVATSPAAVPRPTVGEMADGVLPSNVVDCPVSKDMAAPAVRKEWFTAADPAITTDLWVLKSKEWAGGVTDSQVSKLNGEDVRTIANLEEYIRTGCLVPGRVKGIGQTAVDKISDALMAWRQKNPIPEPVEIEIRTETQAAVEVAPTDCAAESVVPAVSEAESAENTGEIDANQPSPLADGVDVVPVSDAGSAGGAGQTASPAAAPIAAVDPIDPDDALIRAAYVAGCEAGLVSIPEGGKPPKNPHKKGTQLWISWDAGYQETTNA